ncbi:M20/M25/M40 family metallo-hydrolase [SAR202 cluster bacterium AD-804-J14_MRT_500m]|nr:M20/M25/M40 family metallo-hydrolase [SAR202 cluster bacterium AD-804-J14_MRT_500m]
MAQLDELLAQVDAQGEDLIALHRDLVRIPSVNTGYMPTGDETPVCEYAKDWLAKNGIVSEILSRDPNRGNLIARILGSSGNAKLLFMSHTDVVPVEDETKWNYPPFGAEISGGRIYGRGASDCKGLMACQMMATRILKTNAVPLTDDLVLCAGADEEHGGRYGFGWLADNHFEKIKASYAVNEGGGTFFNIAGATTYLVGVGEKGRLEVKITVRGTSAHASTPWLGLNASYRLAEVLKRIESYDATRDTSASLFEHLPTLAIEDVPTPENIDKIIADVEPSNQQVATFLRALSRMTLTPTIISGGIKSNSVPETIELVCDVRTLPHQDDGYLRQQLEDLFEGVEGLDIEIDYMSISNNSPYDNEFADALKEATRISLGRDDLNFIPALTTGFTDSRLLRPKGMLVYGYNGFHPEDNLNLTKYHGTDESIDIKSLFSGTKIMLALAYDLLAKK